jgi:rhamnopyranosyl-N-acetylglucosaminyl-diphospho-decaprenol beta-1,3/1,4-galactofuranosyltransferase
MSDSPTTRGEQRICAVLVTFNRKALMQECLAAVLAQTRPLDGIYIIDNASTDGTPRALFDAGLVSELPPDNPPEPWERTFSHNGTESRPVLIHYVRLSANVGSAGGLREGMDRACRNGYHWLWLMDDDGVPETEALARLCTGAANRPDGRIFNSLVLDKNDRRTIAFGYWLGKNVRDDTPGVLCRTVDELFARTREPVLDGPGQFWNFTLVHRDVVHSVGLPLKELFIRGDEVEYLFRTQTRGFRIYTVPDSLAYHPNPPLNLRTLFGKTFPYESMAAWKRYYKVRNNVFIGKVYTPTKFTTKTLLNTLVANVLLELLDRKPTLTERVSCAWAIMKGVRDGARMARTIRIRECTRPTASPDDKPPSADTAGELHADCRTLV